MVYTASAKAQEASIAERVCPVWAGYFLASPLRKLVQSPRRILWPYISPGMRVLDIGCAMGFFSLPMAELAGPQGRVVCVDLQEGMLERLASRARRARLLDRLQIRKCQPATLGLHDLDGTIDFALAFAVVHEMPDASHLFSEVQALLKDGGRMLVAEPKGHVGREAFAQTVSAAAAHGLRALETPSIAWSHAVLLGKPQ